MALSFRETMRGHLVDETGFARAIEFEVRAEAKSLASLLRSGRLALTGTISAPGYAAVAPLVGHLCVSPLGDRSLTYDVTFDADDGRPLRLLGRKDLDGLSPVQSMTVMAAKLLDGARTIAEGTMAFDLGTLPSFLGSFGPRTAALGPGRAGAVDPELPAADPLTPRDERLLTALGEAMLVAGEKVPAFDERTLRIARRLWPLLPLHVTGFVRTALVALDALCFARTGHRLAGLALERRRDFVEALSRARPAGEALLLLAGLPLRTAHFARADYLAAVGWPEAPPPPNEPEPRWMRQVTAPEALPTEQALECDVVIVGTGAGGATAAAFLAEKGLAVVLIEEGRYERRPQFAGPAEERLLKLWRDGGMVVAIGNAGIGVPLGRMVGGSTAINSGTCYRTPDAVLAEWRAQGFPSDFDPQNFAPWLDLVERELQVEPGGRRYLGEVAKIVAKGADAMGAPHGPLRRNAPSCDGQGQCPIGCPTGAKRSADVSWVPRALRAGAQLFTGLVVSRLLSKGARVVAVEAKGHDAAGAPKRLVVKARAVVLACGSIYGPGLLADHGVRSPWLGKNLSIHPALGLFARLDRPVAPWAAIPQGYGVNDFVDPRLRFEGFYAPPQLAAPAIPYVGRELTRWMDAQDRVVQFGFMVRDRGVGSVLRGPGNRPIVRYDVPPDVVALWTRGAAALTELLLRGGAEEVLTGIAGVDGVTSIEDARAIALRKFRAADFRAMGFHPLGTSRPGATAQEGVVDFDHRVHGTDNLYVMDGSTVPSSLGVNPQVTIMAMAARAASALAARL